MLRTERNYGVSLLKAIMSFEVICCHFLVTSSVSVWQRPFALLENSAVPVFMLLSFILCRKIIISGKPEKIRTRFIRLYWIQFCWALIYWSCYLILGFVDGSGLIGIETLIWQLVTGHSIQLNPTMWFQTDLIILTILFSIIFVWFKPRICYIIILILWGVSIVFQYNGMNYALFEPLRYELKYPMGRFLEVLPYAAVAICFFDSGFLLKIKKHWIVSCLGGSFLFVTSFFLNKIEFLAVVNGFGNSGIPLFVRTVGLVVFFYSLPLEKLGDKFLAFIDVLARYTLGIYCIHKLIGRVLEFVLSRIGIVVDSFVLCVVIYVVSYFVSFIFANTGKKRIISLVQ